MNTTNENDLVTFSVPSFGLSAKDVEYMKNNPNDLESTEESRKIPSQLDRLTEGHEVSESRRASLVRAIELGADDATLIAIRDAARVAKNQTTITLPSHKFENLSRGRGWARQGKGKNVSWGDKADGGYKCGEGRWTVGGNDGFSRKGETDWVVSHVRVGDQTWTIAN